MKRNSVREDTFEKLGNKKWDAQLNTDTRTKKKENPHSNVIDSTQI